MKLSSPRLCLSILAIFSAGTALAQLTSDVVPRERLVPREEQVRRELEATSGRIGPFRLRPQLLLRDIRYTDNVYGVRDGEEKVEDYGATLAAGTRWILPFGPKAYIRGGILPAYTWSAELPERRFLGGTYDVSAIALFNRLTVEGSSGISKGLTAPSVETEVEVIRDLSWYGLDAELDLSGYISLFGSAHSQNLEHDSGAIEAGPASFASSLDREDTAVRAGIRYRLTSFLDFSLAAERSRTSFDVSPGGRNNSSDAVLLGMHYERPRSYLNLTVGQREYEPDGPSSIEPFDETVGSYFAALATGGPVEIQGFGRREVSYSLSQNTLFILGNHHGLGAILRAGERIRVRITGELGSNDYRSGPQSVEPILRRIDDVTTYGAGLDIRLYRNVALTFFVYESVYDSNIDEFDRSTLGFRTGLTIGGITLAGDFPR